MVGEDISPTVRLVDHLRAESAEYFRKWIYWLGVGSGGSIIALLAFAANLQNPDKAIQSFLPSLWIFLMGVMSAGLTLLFRSLAAGSAGEHFAEAHNRQQFSTAANKLPQIISSPPLMADGLNRERDLCVSKSDKAHAAAENAWKRRSRFFVAANVCITVSALSFILGVAWLLIYFTLGGRIA